MKFAEKLIKWYNKNKRDLPWRNTTDPYKIWISEIILQQTRVEQGLSYYHEFIKAFPDLDSLKSASEQDVLKVVQGAGYYRRFLNMKILVEELYESYEGKFPGSYKELIKLKGIGSYTGAAIASFSFRESVPVVDGNVFRVLSRFLENGQEIDTGKGKKIFFELAEELIDVKQPDTFNQAIMELGALVCKPAKPNCGNCPVNIDCKAFANSTVAQFPRKSKLMHKQERYLCFLDIRMDGKLLLMKRRENDIWKNLYCFPVLEFKSALLKEEIFASDEFQSVFPEFENTGNVSIKHMNHKLTHQNIHATFLQIQIEKEMNVSIMERGLLVTVNSIDDYPLPRLIEKYIRNE